MSTWNKFRHVSLLGFLVSLWQEDADNARIHGNGVGMLSRGAVRTAAVDGIEFTGLLAGVCKSV